MNSRLEARVQKTQMVNPAKPDHLLLSWPASREFSTPFLPDKMKSNRNSGKPWTPRDNAVLKRGAAHGRPTGLIAWDLGRTKAGVYSHASELGVSLHPNNQ